MVVWLSWLSGRALAAQARGILDSTPGDCWPFHSIFASKFLIWMIMLMNGANDNRSSHFPFSCLLSVCHQNTVVSLQPATAPTPVVIPSQTDAPTYFILSLLTFILCSFIGGLVFMFCAAPALVCSNSVRFNNLIEIVKPSHVREYVDNPLEEPDREQYVRDIFC